MQTISNHQSSNDKNCFWNFVFEFGSCLHFAYCVLLFSKGTTDVLPAQAAEAAEAEAEAVFPIHGSPGPFDLPDGGIIRVPAAFSVPGIEGMSRTLQRGFR